jgi:hypothetical protein
VADVGVEQRLGGAARGRDLEHRAERMAELLELREVARAEAARAVGSHRQHVARAVGEVQRQQQVVRAAGARELVQHPVIGRREPVQAHAHLRAAVDHALRRAADVGAGALHAVGDALDLHGLAALPVVGPGRELRVQREEAEPQAPERRARAQQPRRDRLDQRRRVGRQARLAQQPVDDRGRGPGAHQWSYRPARALPRNTR